jgi:hypothetical protein
MDQETGICLSGPSAGVWVSPLGDSELPKLQAADQGEGQLRQANQERGDGVEDWDSDTEAEVSAEWREA